MGIRENYMLVYKPGHHLGAELDSIHNYYEQLVFAELLRRVNQENLNAELLPDIACVALNHLPPRYIRHDVDMAFYLSPKEYEEIENKVQQAVNHGVDFVLSRGLRENNNNA